MPETHTSKGLSTWELLAAWEFGRKESLHGLPCSSPYLDPELTAEYRRGYGHVAQSDNIWDDQGRSQESEAKP